MKKFEAMVLVDNKDNYYLTPKGITRSGSHPNVVFMSAPAYDIDAAKRYFQTQGVLMSNVKEVAWVETKKPEKSKTWFSNTKVSYGKRLNLGRTFMKLCGKEPDIKLPKERLAKILTGKN